MTGCVWNMKKRNIDCGKLRRPPKRSKIPDGIYVSLLTYGKFLAVWSAVLTADFLLEFRFEYLWPLWLLMRSAFDSFRYQGLMFCLLFVGISVMADVLCYIFVPAQWLYFAASTYVWVQYVWHTDRGLGFPTVLLWLLCIYMEIAVRLKDAKCLPFQFDICRPFAAHCIGYPLVTLGFGFKTYVSFKFRLRKQKEVQKANSFYMELLQQAVPVDQLPDQDEMVPVSNVASSADLPTRRKTLTSSTNVTDCSSKELQQCSFSETSDAVADGDRRLSATDLNDAHHHQNSSTKVAYKTSMCGKADNITTALARNNRDDVINRLKSDLKRVKADLQTSRMTEQELRSQITTITTNERTTRCEIEQLRQDNDSLQSKLHNLVTSRQQDKQTLASLERKLQEERKLRTNVEQQLTAEKKKTEENLANATKAASMTNASRTECSDACHTRLMELERDLKQMSWHLKCRDEQLLRLQTETQLLRQYKDSQQDAELLMSALLAQREKNAQLEMSLSAETRLKMDLFSALGEAKRHVEVQHASLMHKEAEIAELKSKVAEAMALVPSAGFGGFRADSPPHFSAAFTTPQSDAAFVKSNLTQHSADYEQQ